MLRSHRLLHDLTRNQKTLSQEIVTFESNFYVERLRIRLTMSPLSFEGRLISVRIYTCLVHDAELFVV